ncbi:MAG: MOSC domain-containing protein [Acidobacteriota bacterium]
MTPKLLSVNVAVPGVLRARGREVKTGIFKEPAAGRVALGRLGLEGDFQADHRYHGGPEQAVYAFSSEHSARFAADLGKPETLPPGFFGENFTTAGLTEGDCAVGDVFRVGSATVQVTKPRSPCFKLGLRIGSAAFLKRFLESGRIGFYLRVLEEGEVGARDEIRQIERPSPALLVSDLIRLLYFRPVDPESLQRALAARGLPSPMRERLAEIREETSSRLF